MKKFLTALVIIVAVIVAGLGYLGFVPGVSDVMGSNKPRDLGVTYTDADVKSADIKNPVKLVTLPATTPASESIKYSGQTKINAHFTSAEITAMAAARQWSNWPLKDIQARANPDGTGEASGMIIVSRIPGYAAAAGVSPDVVQQVMDSLKLNKDMPFYIKAAGGVTDNQVALDIQKVEIGRMPIPASLVQEHNQQVAAFAEDQIRKMTGTDIKTLKVENGGVTLVGKIPAVESRTIGQ